VQIEHRPDLVSGCRNCLRDVGSPIINDDGSAIRSYYKPITPSQTVSPNAQLTIICRVGCCAAHRRPVTRPRPPARASSTNARRFSRNIANDLGRFIMRTLSR
jgi:hypothetical protein